MAVLLCVGGVVWPAVVEAGSMTFAWDANSETDLAGYKFYYDVDSGAPYLGSQANEGTSPIVVPLTSLSDPSNPTYTITGLPSCQHFYFAVTAYDTHGNESDYSGEVDGTVLANANPVTATAAGAGTLLLQWQAPPGDDLGTIPLYRIHYDSDPGEPYSGYGSPSDVPRSMLSDPDHPDILLTGLADATTYYLVVESECGDGTSKMSDEVVGSTSGGGTGGTGGTGSPGTGGTGASGDHPGSGGTGAGEYPAGSGGTSPGDDNPGAGGTDANIPWGGSGGESGDPWADNEAEPGAIVGELRCGVRASGRSPRGVAPLGLLLLMIGALGGRRARR